MSRSPFVAIVLLAFASAAIAGCLGGTSGPADSSGSDDTDPGGRTDHPEATDRPHVHDRWDGLDRKVLMDETVSTEWPDPFDDETRPGYTAFEMWGGPSTAIFTLPDGKIVPPGTDNLTITAEWSSQRWPGTPVTWTDLDLRYKPANDNQWVTLGERPSGQPWTINVTVPMADGGHAKASLWQFQLAPEDYLGRDGQVTVGTERMAGGEFEADVRIVADRVDGELPKEPPHPDWWANGSAREIANVSGDGASTGAAVVQVETPSDSTSVDLGPGDHGLVPPGTRQLVGLVTWEDESPTGDQAAPGPKMEWRNSWNEPEQPWSADLVEPGRATYVLPLDPDMTDGMYADRSRWLFAFRMEGEDLGPSEPLFGNRMSEPWQFEGSWNLRLWAVNSTGIPSGAPMG